MGTNQTKKARTQRAAQARAEQQRAERARRLRTRGVLGVVALMVVAGIGYLATANHNGSSSPDLGPEGIALQQGTVLAAQSSAATGQTIDGIKCESAEQVAYHVHAHLAVYVDGELRPIPIGVGIVQPQIQQLPGGAIAGATTCYYWLHVHAQDGIIHVESPAQNAVYTLGNFFDIWRQPLSSSQVATARGPVTAYVDGRAFSGDIRSIPLIAHATIQLDVGSPAPAPVPVNWSKSSL